MYLQLWYLCIIGSTSLFMLMWAIYTCGTSVIPTMVCTINKANKQEFSEILLAKSFWWEICSIFLHQTFALPYSIKLWWKSLTKFDEWSMSESLTSKTLTNWVRFLFALVKNYCGIIICSWRLRTCKFHISVLELASYSYNNF